MGIGDKVKAAAVDKAEQELNDKGQLSGRQFKELVTLGMGLSDARELAASGIPYDDIKEIAEAHSRNLALARSANGVGDVLSQNAAMMEKIIEKARNRRPESYNGDFPFPNISALNPDGDAAPPPPFKCAIHEGSWEKDQGGQPKLESWKVGPEHNQLTKTEIRLLNQLEPGEYAVDNYDGEPGTVRVIGTRNDATGALEVLTIYYPKPWVNKASKGLKKPILVRMLADILNVGSYKAEAINKWLAEKESVAVAA